MSEQQSSSPENQIAAGLRHAVNRSRNRGLLSDAPALATVRELELAAHEIDRLEHCTGAKAFADLQWLIGEGYHDFEWDYDSDAETLMLRSGGIEVAMSLHDFQGDSTAASLAKLRSAAASR